MISEIIEIIITPVFSIWRGGARNLSEKTRFSDLAPPLKQIFLWKETNVYVWKWTLFAAREPGQDSPVTGAP